MIQLNSHNILHWLEPKIASNIEIITLNCIASTQDFLKNHTSQTQNSIILCCAEKQTHGRGRLGRTWMSDIEGNLYASLKITIEKKPRQLTCLSLLVGLTIINTLQQYGIQQDIQLKWPNDLIWQQKKLGGILLEILNYTDTHTTVIIGIGINIEQHPTKTDRPQACCSLNEIQCLQYDRNHLIALWLNIFTMQLNKFIKNGWQEFATAWQQVDYLKDKKIQITQNNQIIRGYVTGVSLDGELKIKTDTAECLTVVSGDIQLL